MSVIHLFFLVWYSKKSGQLNRGIMLSFTLTSLLFLVLLRKHIPKCSMMSLCVIKYFNVFKDRCYNNLMIWVYCIAYPFSFQTFEEMFHVCVVPALCAIAVFFQHTLSPQAPVPLKEPYSDIFSFLRTWEVFHLLHEKKSPSRKFPFPLGHP